MEYQGAYKILRSQIETFVQQILNNINAGQPMPEIWKIGDITHIRKNSTLECTNYRPICLTQLIYKIWYKLQTNRIARILHLLTPNNQFRYKNGLSAIDAIIRLEHATQAGTQSAKIILMNLSKAFDCVNRTTLWTTLYKAGLPMQAIQNTQQGHQGAKLQRNDSGTYGAPEQNNVGVFQGSALSSILFIIYLGDMMQDHQSLNGQMKLPKRYSIHTREEMHTHTHTHTPTPDTHRKKNTS